MTNLPPISIGNPHKHGHPQDGDGQSNDPHVVEPHRVEAGHCPSSLNVQNLPHWNQTAPSHRQN